MSSEMKRLLVSADLDGDHKITVNDARKPSALRFDLRKAPADGAGGGQTFEVVGTYFLANLLQELKLAEEQKVRELSPERIFEAPVARLKRSIATLYWPALTRRIDRENIGQVIEDPKIGLRHIKTLYVPSSDPVAYAYFTSPESPKGVSVRKLSDVWSREVERELAQQPGLLSLALKDGQGVPYVVPGGRFNEMYGWDSYFEALGLLADGRLDLAQAMVDNFVYQIRHYGKILNANRTYYLNRSQPPFLTSMIAAVYAAMPVGRERVTWLRDTLPAAVQEYENVWTNAARLTPMGLSRYYGNGWLIPFEVESGHFDYVLKPEAKRLKLSVPKLVERYNAGQIVSPKLDDFFAQDRAVRESGHDTTYRWTVGGEDRAADFVTVDLNSLLYKYERDLQQFIDKELRGRLTLVDGRVSRGDDWRERADRRRELMHKFLWNAERKMFFDYNFKTEKQSSYVSATAFYPFWVGLLNDEDAVASSQALLGELEVAGGLAATSAESLKLARGAKGHARQWDYPNGWAPHQMIAWSGLEKYGLRKDANRLRYKWLYTILRNAVDYNGTIPEKFDVVKRSHAVFAEYGNVGTKFSYITREGFGWMNASFQVGWRDLDSQLKPDLEKLVPPEWLIDRK